MKVPIRLPVKKTRTRARNASDSPLPRPRPSREIFLVLPASYGPNREILRGIYEFAYPAHRWQLIFLNQTEQAILSTLGRKPADGLIGQLGRGDLARAVKRLKIPVVNIHGGRPFEGLPQVGVDLARLAAYAAERLLEYGLPNHGFYGLGGQDFSEVQEESFCRRMARAGKEVSVFSPKPEERRVEFHGGKSPASQWIVSCPKPVAVYCANDVLSHELGTVCLQEGLAVPQDVILLGSNNDELLCLACLPPLSSIRLPYKKVGLRAAALLERLMDGGRVPRRPELIDQPDLVERQSTMRGHSEDPHVERALQWMCEHFAHGIGIESVAKFAGVSVRSLQKRFLRALGRTPLQELKTLRIEQIKRMLRDEDRTLEEIADACQISSGIYLSQFFKRETGMTPGAYRKIFRSTDST